MDDIYKNIEEYIPIKKREILIAFDDMIADMLSNKNLNLIVTELIVFITQSYFAVPKKLDWILRTVLLWKIPNTREFHQIAFSHLSDIDFNDFVNLKKKSTAKPYFFLVTDATLASDKLSDFRMSVLEVI